MLTPRVHEARQRDRGARRHRQAPLLLGPEVRLTRIGEHDAGRPLVVGGTLLRPELAHDANHASLVDASLPADDAVREDAEVLRGLAEYNHDAARLVDVFGGEDGHAGALAGVQGQIVFLEPEGL